MKNLTISALAVSTLMFSSHVEARKLDCNIDCSEKACGSAKDTWNQCFKECWRYKEYQIHNCERAAFKENYVSQPQREIMDLTNEAPRT